MTKDNDFVDLVERLGSPPKIIWLRCGNTTNSQLKEILNATLLDSLELLNSGEVLDGLRENAHVAVLPNRCGAERAKQNEDDD